MACSNAFAVSLKTILCISEGDQPSGLSWTGGLEKHAKYVSFGSKTNCCHHDLAEMHIPGNMTL